MTIYLTELSQINYTFPSPLEALSDPNGLLAFGGDLAPERVLNAYCHGIFPWYGPNEPILWWSPSPRAVFNPITFKPSRSVKKFQRKKIFSISINKATNDVIDYCASIRPENEQWLNSEMRATYKELHTQGVVHSVEVWQKEKLIGGLYGVQIGTLFCGESMFSLETNASKIALWYFCRHFSSHGGELIDCQVMNPHLKSLGAQEINRENFLTSLQLCNKKNVHSDCFKMQNIPQFID